MSRYDVADLDLAIGDDHSIDQQLHELALLGEVGAGQTGLNSLAKFRGRSRLGRERQNLSFVIRPSSAASAGSRSIAASVLGSRNSRAPSSLWSISLVFRSPYAVSGRQRGDLVQRRQVWGAA